MTDRHTYHHPWSILGCTSTWIINMTLRDMQRLGVCVTIHSYRVLVTNEAITAISQINWLTRMNGKNTNQDLNGSDTVCMKKSWSLPIKLFLSWGLKMLWNKNNKNRLAVVCTQEQKYIQPLEIRSCSCFVFSFWTTTFGRRLLFSVHWRDMHFLLIYVTPCLLNYWKKESEERCISCEMVMVE